MESSDKVALAFIVGMVLLSIISCAVLAITETIQKTSCFENGGSWEKSTCHIDKKQEQ